MQYADNMENLSAY